MALDDIPFRPFPIPDPDSDVVHDEWEDIPDGDELTLDNSPACFGLDTIHVMNDSYPTDLMARFQDEDTVQPDGIEGVTSITRLPKFVPGLPRRLWTRSSRLILNVHSNLEGSLELAPFLQPSQQTERPAISPVTMAQLVKAVRRELEHEGPFILSGCSAMMPPDDTSRETAEGVVNILVHGDRGFDLTRFAQGGTPGSDEVTVFEKPEADGAFYAIAQWAVYENRPSPLIVEVEGTDLTPAKITEIAHYLGIIGPFAVQVYVREGTTQARAVRDLPPEDTDISGFVDEHMASPTLSAPTTGVGVATDTPYTQDGHIHVLSSDHQRGGHFVGVPQGKVVLSFSPGEHVIYGQYDPRTVSAEVL